MAHTLSTLSVGTVLACGSVVTAIVPTSWGAWITVETQSRCTVHRSLRNGDAITDYLF